MAKLAWPYPEIGTRIKMARDALGLTLEGLGERLNVTHATLSRYENATRPIPISDLYRLSRVLGVKPCDLLPESNVVPLRDAEFDALVYRLSQLNADERRLIRAVVDQYLIRQVQPDRGYETIAAHVEPERPLTDVERAEIERQARTVKEDESGDLDE